MRAVYADTSFYVALLSPRDSHHRRAVELASALRGSVFTTEYVLLELATFFSAVPNRGTFLKLLELLSCDAQTTVVPSSTSLWRRGLVLFAERLDKEWSLTDCISFVVMHDHELTESLTADHHFEQAGFVALMN